MSEDALFPPTPAERLESLAAFVREEAAHRWKMRSRYPDKADYWQGRIDQADAALEHIGALRYALEHDSPAKRANDAVAGAHDPRAEWPP